MLLPTISAACSAAEPCHTPSTRVGRPPTAAANGTVASISTVPGRNNGFSCFSNSACPAKGTVSTTMSDILTAVALSAPSTLPKGPTFSAIRAASALARSASREPMMTDSPARAQRSASPDPSGPVPPTIAIIPGYPYPLLNPMPYSSIRFASSHPILLNVCRLSGKFNGVVSHRNSRPLPLAPAFVYNPSEPSLLSGGLPRAYADALSAAPFLRAVRLPRGCAERQCARQHAANAAEEIHIQSRHAFTQRRSHGRARHPQFRGCH